MFTFRNLVMFGSLVIAMSVVACGGDDSTSSGTSSGGGESTGSSGSTSSSGSNAPATKAAAGEECDTDADCVDNLCATTIDPPLCTKLCTDASECPAALPVCRAIGSTGYSVCGKEAN